MPKPPLPAELVEILRRPNPAVMATVRPDGGPSTAATWYLWDDGEILLNLAADRARLEHLRADPRVSLTVLDGEEWYRHVTLRGTVTLQDDPELTDIDRLSTHYLGQPYSDRESARVSAWMSVRSYFAWSGGAPWHAG